MHLWNECLCVCVCVCVCVYTHIYIYTWQLALIYNLVLFLQLMAREHDF